MHVCVMVGVVVRVCVAGGVAGARACGVCVVAWDVGGTRASVGVGGRLVTNMRRHLHSTGMQAYVRAMSLHMHHA